MKLLILTQKVDKTDTLLGFFHRWIEEFSKEWDEVTVICLGKGAYDLPSNAHVFSLGKESQRSKVKGQRFINRLRYTVKFYRYAWEMRNNYDCVFVHMNREYVLLGGLLWRMLGKKIALWWVHFETPLALRIAERLAHIVFTASEESFQLRSRKKRVVGHGIDLQRFTRAEVPQAREPYRLLYVGKITPIKNIDVLLEAVRLLKTMWSKNFVVHIVGPTTTDEDRTYLKNLKTFVREHGLETNVRFWGSIPYEKIHERYADTDLVVNLCPTGGIDKMVVEGMASRLPVIVANETFKDMFGEYWDNLSYPYRDANALAGRIRGFFEMNEFTQNAVRTRLFGESRNHDLPRLITKMSDMLKKV